MAFGDTFLNTPDLFPARLAGESWGDRHVAVDLPGGPYHFYGFDAAQDEAIRSKMVDFLIQDPAGDQAIKTRVFRAARSDFREFDTKGWVYKLEMDCQPSAVRIAGLDFMGKLNWNPELTGGFWTSVHEDQKFLCAFANYFRILSAYRLLEKGGVLVHSAGVANDKGAYVFIGTSGSGKTTLSRLSLEAGRRVLSDDMNILLPGEDGPVVNKVPFAGELGPTATDRRSYPLKAVCRLEKGEVNALRPMGTAEAIATLMTCSPNVNHNPFRRRQLLEILTSIVRTAPAYVLTFTKEGGIWDVLEEIA